MTFDEVAHRLDGRALAGKRRGVALEQLEEETPVHRGARIARGVSGRKRRAGLVPRRRTC
jgi:hypothetical protein